MVSHSIKPAAKQCICYAGLAAVLQHLAPEHTGYHYTRKQLDQFDDPDEAHARRGAHWTFDGAAFVEKMLELQKTGAAE